MFREKPYSCGIDVMLQQQMTTTTVVFGIVLWLFFIIAFFAIGLLLCIWVYRDAQKRGMNGALWLIIVLVGNVIGLLVYLIVREPEKTYTLTVRYCKYCGNPMTPDAKFCPKCGKEQL